jgi:predicted amidohydrolase YtcJ
VTTLLAVVAFATGCSGKDGQQDASQPAAAMADAAQAADAIYFGGDIVTINDAQPTVEALAVKDGRILAVGSRTEVEKAHLGAATQAVDLAGRTLLPGFMDAHSHYINSLLVANQAKLYAPPSGPGKDVDSIIAELKKFAAERKIPKGELIMGYGYDDTVMPNGRLLNRDDLDKAFPTIPCGSTTCRCTAR